MINAGVYILYLAALVLIIFALSRHDSSLKLGLARAVEQFVKLVPRMICAMIAAGFMVKLIPIDIIGRFLGAEAGMSGVLIGSLTGLIVPSGPVVSFAIAAAFANEGASAPALVSFITGWSLFAAHRVIIFEIPLLGNSFVRLRMLSVAILPFLAGTITLAVTKFLFSAGF